MSLSVVTISGGWRCGVACAAGGRPLAWPWFPAARGRRGSGVRAGPQGRRRRRCASSL